MTATLESRPIASIDETLTPPPAPVVQQPAVPQATPGARGRAVGATMGTALAALSGWAFTQGISVPWPWSDEGATFLALQRSFSQILVLSHGPDAPLVPYYLIAKAWTGAVAFLAPQVSTLTAARLLSAAAACATVVVLYALVARNAGRLAGLLAGVLLVSLPGFDRLAQEARPYTLLALAATTSWWAWDRWLHPDRRPGLWPSTSVPALGERGRTRVVAPAAGYVLGLVATAAIHTFGLFQWPAQALATLLDRGGARWSRWRTAGVTLMLMAVAGVLVAVQVLASVEHGTGSRAPNAARVVNLATSTAQVLRGAFLSGALPAVLPVLLLAIVGFVGTRATRGFAVTLAVWLVVPLALELGLSVVRTNLFRSRYWIADLPPLAAAAGLGLTVLVEALWRLVAREGAAGVARRVAGTAAVAAVLVGVLGVQGVTQAREQAHLRAPSGHHSENLAPLLRVVDAARARRPGLPVLISSGPASGIVGAARPGLEAGNPLRRLDPATADVYTVPLSQASVRSAIGGSHLLLWVFRGRLTAAAAAARIPHGLAGLHLRVRSAIPAGRWTAIMLAPGGGGVIATSTAKH